METNPIRPSNDEARTLARNLINTALFGSLGVNCEGHPMVTRIAVATDEVGCPITLISDLSNHTKCLRDQPRASLLVGEPGPRGDPLTHPRLTLMVNVTFIDKSDALVDRYLVHQPKAKLYIGFTDFHFVRMTPIEAHLNGGFGRAFKLTAADLHL